MVRLEVTSIKKLCGFLSYIESEMWLIHVFPLSMYAMHVWMNAEYVRHQAP